MAGMQVGTQYMSLCCPYQPLMWAANRVLLALCTLVLCFHGKGLEGFLQLNNNKGSGKGEFC